MNSLAICILFFEKLEQTKECITTFLPSGAPIYVLNNGSSEKSLANLKACFAGQPQVHILTSPTNLGVAAGRNILWRTAKEDWLFFIDNDITIQPAAWREIAERYILQYGHSISVFTPELYNVHEMRVVPRCSFSPSENSIIERPSTTPFTNMFPGGAALIRRNLLEKLNGYAEELFVGLEDFELAIRAAKTGLDLRVMAISEIRLVHEHIPAKIEHDRAAARERYAAAHVEHASAYLKNKYDIFCAATAWAAEKERHLLGPDSDRQKQTKIAPQLISLYMTDQCNLSCKICRRNTANDTRHADMSVQILQKALRSYPDIRSARIAGFGEPTLNLEFFPILRLLADNAVKSQVITNGTNPKILGGLSREHTQVSISLYGYDRESFYTQTGKDRFGDVMRSYALLRENGVPVGFSWIQKKNKHEILARIIDFCDALEPDFLHIQNYFASVWTEHEERQHVLTLEDEGETQAIQKIINSRSYVTPPSYLRATSPMHTCQSYLIHLSLDGDGNIGCCRNQLPPSRLWGNIVTDDDPFNAPTIQRLRSRAIQGCAPHGACLYCFHRTKRPNVYPSPTLEEILLVQQTGLFDEAWYREHYLLGRQEIMPPIEHFLQFGPLKGYQPNPKFNSSQYLIENPDAAKDGVNPILHYICNHFSKV